MTDKQRTFLLGAGFSKAVADGPLMNEIWDYIVKAHENEKNRKVSIIGKNKRLNWFNKLDDFIKRLEGEATLGFDKSNFDEIRVGVRENLEYMFTIIDLHLSGPKIKFKRKGWDIEPYPAIPLSFTSRTELREIKSCLLTYLYIIFEKLRGNNLIDKFAGGIIDDNDEIIIFNYDLVLEKELWKRNIWSPLNGYVGVNRFRSEKDEKELKKAKKYSKTRIHKMHGSICWFTPEYLMNRPDSFISIDLDNNENWGFHFNGLEKTLKRDPVQPTMKMEREVSEGWGGKHYPSWILPSFIKLFQQKEYYEIWRSALKVMSKTDELVIIGYSFRPEDSSAYLLVSSLPDECNITLVDPYPEDIKEKLEKLGLKVNNTYKSLEEYLSR